MKQDDCPHCWHGFEFRVHGAVTKSGRACCMCPAAESDGPPEPPAEQAEMFSAEA